jgi:hypothetical protein
MKIAKLITEILCALRNRKFYYRVPSKTPLKPILSQMKSVRTLSYSFKFHYNITCSILIYKSQQGAHATEFILSDNCSTCFGRHHHRC